VVVQAGDEVGTSETRHVQNNVIAVLRGRKEGLPEFEWWRHWDYVKGQYYLMCYHKAPPGTSAWESFRLKKPEAGFIILKFFTDDRSGFYGSKAEYKDMALEKLKELIKEVPFESDTDKTEYHKHGMVKAHAGNVTLKSDPVAAIRSVLPKAWNILKVEEGTYPPRGLKGNGKAIFLFSSEQHLIPKQSRTSVVYIMPADYQYGEDPAHGEAATYRAVLILTTPTAKVYLLGNETPFTATGWPTLKHDITTAVSGCIGVEKTKEKPKEGGVQQTPPPQPSHLPAGQEERIAAEIAHLGSPSKAESAAAVRALIKRGKPAAAALVKVLGDPRSDVRALAAEALRSILATDPANAPNYHEKAYWEGRLAQLKAGMSLDQALKVLLPNLSPAERRKTMQVMFTGGGGSTSTYRLDDYWMVVIYSYEQMHSQAAKADRQGLQHNSNTSFEQGRLSPTPPVLARQVLQVPVARPPRYSGVWVTWHVNGQKATEVEYRNGRCDGAFTTFYDDGRQCVSKHYTTGVCHGTETGWYRSGKKQYEGRCEHGRRIGTWQWWKENGQIESTREFTVGKQVQKTGK